MKNKLHKKILTNFKEKSYINYLLIIVVSILMCIPLLSKNLNIYIDDGIQHIARLIGTFDTLQEGQFLPMIMSDLCNNFGYSWNIFYSPLTAYAPLIFKIFNFTFVNCLKLFIFAVTILTGISMYKFVLKVTKNKNIATLAAILYVLAPYRITDMYIRVAIAELASFIFLPMIFNGMYTIINEEKKSYLLAWGTIGLILTHTVITLYTAIICIIYLLVFVKKLKNKEIIKNLLINLGFAVASTSFYWIGLFQHYFATSYEVFVPGRMQRLEVLEYYKIRFYELFYTAKNQIMVYAIGLLTVVGLILTPIAYKEISKEYRKMYTLFLILGLILIVMSLTIFPFEKLPGILTMIQFTFRLFEFTSFFFAFIAAVNYGVLIKNFRIRDVLVLSTIAILLLIPYNDKIDYNTKNSEERLIQGVRVTENTGRVHAGMASMEYIPSKMFNNLDYLVNREDEPIILNNEHTQIISYEKNNSNMTMELSNVNQNTIIELPYTYYLGYRIHINNEEIEYTESDNGFIQINIKEQKDSEPIKIIVKYLGTNEMLIATAISVIAVIGLAILHTKNKLNNNHF